MPKHRLASPPTSLLFTSFEPSGDDHAAAVIAQIKRRHPDLPIYAWGGPRMEAAGAEIVEYTGKDAVMGLPGPGKVLEHVKINKRIARWVGRHRPKVHIPVDSPAANFPICKITKKAGAHVVHLVAPQVWAWGSWRIRKLRRLTDKVLCLLPFEEEWFRSRGVDAVFVGHPLFDERLDLDRLDLDAGRLPFGDAASPRLALMPGSRPSEISRNFPVILECFRELAACYPGIHALVAATNEEVEAKLRAMAESSGGVPERLEIVHSKTDEVIRWSTLALVVSGTVTLQIARQRRPMVIFYKSSAMPQKLLYLLAGWWVFTTEFFTLPNLIAGREIVPEFAPHFEGAAPLVKVVRELIDRPELAALQVEHLDGISRLFDSECAAVASAEAISRMAGLSATSVASAPGTVGAGVSSATE